MAVFFSISQLFHHSHTTLNFSQKAIKQPPALSPTSKTIIIMSDKQTSTLQSYVDSATGAIQSAVGNIMGTTGDQVCCLPTSLLRSPMYAPTNHLPPISGRRPTKEEPSSRRERALPRRRLSRPLRRLRLRHQHQRPQPHRRFLEPNRRRRQRSHWRPIRRRGSPSGGYRAESAW